MTDIKDRPQDLRSFRPNKLSYAISAVLACPAGAVMAQDQDQNEDSIATGALEEVLVTARKRTESIMDVPESIQAISGADLEVAGLHQMDDYVRFIPSMSYMSSNPGSAVIIFRGISDSGENFIAESTAALYMDETSLTLNATPDPRMVDIERIEALSGPQGTLYGANAQSGLLRVITNKPDPSGFDAYVDVMGRTGADSDFSYDANAMVNIPLSDTFAIRLVGFSAEDGGFIDNVNGDSVPNGIWNNAGTEVENFNSVEYLGGRLSARWFPSDNWTVTGNIIYQDTQSNGRPERDPTLAQELSVSRFYPDKEYDDTNWTQYGLTIEGDLGFADFVSATAYFTRDWTYTQDTQPYASYFGQFCYDGYYYAYSNYSPYCFQTPDLGNYYYNDPVGYLINVQKDTKFSQEFRLAHSGERFDWVAGIYYEESDQDWVFDTFETYYGYDNSKSYQNYLEGRLYGDPTVTNSQNRWWRSADSTNQDSWAVFGEWTVHLTDRWDVTLGGRYFDRDVHKVYYVETPGGNVTSYFDDLDANDSDFLPKFSVSFSPNENSLLYALYSEGFRPGGTNRTRSPYGFFPVQYDEDLLKNIEFGGKFTLWDGRARLSLTYYDMTWENYQLELIDPSQKTCGSPGALPEPQCGQPWQKVVGNIGGDASSNGIEVQFDAQATQNLNVNFNATWIDAQVDDGFSFLIPVPAGSRLPLSPEFKASASLQYAQNADWFNGAVNDWYARLQWSYVGDMLNQVEPFTCCDFDDPNYGPAPQLTQPSYNIGDFRFGVDGDTWTVVLFVNNITDEVAILYDNVFEFDYYFGKGRQTINRPREYGIQFIKRFGKR